MVDERLKTLGLNIKFARLKKNISQEQLAELTNTTRTTISLIETAKLNPTILKIVDISKALDTKIDTLVDKV